ncbi:MAG: hypothetical protein IJU81_02685 [Bacteroidales bacterium]|nr:hypothetical protein [Bacteroidales bacterium]
MEFLIKVEIEESDYAEQVAKQLKSYKNKATVPGFRKGMAPMGLIQRMYKGSVVADVVNDLIANKLNEYFDAEKLDIIGSPLMNEDKTGQLDFDHEKGFVFYFDAALMPEVKIDWTKVQVPLNQIKVTPKEVEKQIEDIAMRMGSFETPDTIGENDYVYGKLEELDKNGNVKEGGVSTFMSFSLNDLKDKEMKPLFVGKKAEEKVRFTVNKAFSASDIQTKLRLDEAAAKKFKSEVELTISGCSRITPHEVNEEFFGKVFPGEGIKDLATFKKKLSKDIEEGNREQCRVLYVNQVRKALMDNFDTSMPEAFLKRWIVSRIDKDKNASDVEAEWNDKYVPGLKWEMIDVALSKIGDLEPTQNEIVDAVKDLLRRQDVPAEGETKQQIEERLEQSARTIAKDRENIARIVDRLRTDKVFAIFESQLKPEPEKVSMKEFEQRCKQ